MQSTHMSLDGASKVRAIRITDITISEVTNKVVAVMLATGETKQVHPRMCAHDSFTPSSGDYFVSLDNGLDEVVPREPFERKYTVSTLDNRVMQVITHIQFDVQTDCLLLKLEDGSVKSVGAEVANRHAPRPGDYYEELPSGKVILHSKEECEHRGKTPCEHKHDDKEPGGGQRVNHGVATGTTLAEEAAKYADNGVDEEVESERHKK